MKLFFKDINLNDDVSFCQVEKMEESKEFNFDDEPLGQILYGQNPNNGPTPANLYLPAIEYVQRIAESFYKHRNTRNVVERAFELSRKGYPISKTSCFELATIMNRIVPDYPNPLIEFDLSDLRLLLEQMWNCALRTEDKELQEEVGTSLYRWYEHYCLHEAARKVLTTMIQNYRSQRNHHSEAVMINNFAFEYLLEGRYQEAIPFFENAAKIFMEYDDTYQHANSRANYWICRFECGDLEEVAEIETDMKTIAENLSEGIYWHRRKALILFAKIEEQRRNIFNAIKFVKEAIECCKESNTRYPELDRKYLEHLKRK